MADAKMIIIVVISAINIAVIISGIVLILTNMNVNQTENEDYTENIIENVDFEKEMWDNNEIQSFSMNAPESWEIVPNQDAFLWGISTSAYQTEGAWNESGKGESIFDHLTHFFPDRIEDYSNADVAADSYHKVDEDLRLLVELGVNAYRFSISWARIFPTGYPYKQNMEGINYYNDLIDKLINLNITPLLTLFHFDLPFTLQEIGGWLNPYVIDYFLQYFRVAYKYFGDRVTLWATFNEPAVFCRTPETTAIVDYNKSAVSDATAPYLCIRTLLLAHATVYREFKALQPKEEFNSFKGKMGIVVKGTWTIPSSNETEDIEAAKRYVDFFFEIIMHPIFSTTGDFPPTVKQRIANISAQEGFLISRLPEFKENEIDFIRGTADFLGLIHYESYLISNMVSNSSEPSIGKDASIQIFNDSWVTGYPPGFYHLLMYIKEKYSNLEIYVVENGFSEESFEDTNKIEYLRTYLENMLQAKNEGCRISGYFVWSLLDCFEWNYGYTQKFGLYHVNFSDPNRTRTPRLSASWYHAWIRNHLF